MKKEQLPDVDMTAQAPPMPVEAPAEMPPMETAEALPTESAAPGNNAEIAAIIEKYFPGTDMPQEEAVLDLLTKLDRVQEKLMVAIENDPDFGAALDEIFKGGEARVAIARAYGPDAFTAVDGDPDFDQMTEAFGQGREKLNKKREYAETLKSNQEMSVKEIESWLDEKGYSEDEVVARLKLMQEIKEDFINDKLTKKHLNLLDKAMDYDTAVQDAEEAGKVAGRNEKIVEKKTRDKLSTDGLPSIAAAAPKTPTPKPKSFGQSFMDGVI